MALYLGHRGRKIQYVGSEPLLNSSLEMLEVSDDLKSITPRSLIDGYEIRRGQVLPKSLKAHKSLRVAFVGVYRIPCGIATYSEWLWAEMIKQVGEYRIFAEESMNPVPEEANVVRCWKRGKPMTELIDQILAYDPDVIYIQHEYGIFPIARHWISLLTALQKYRVITTLHSVYTHKDKVVCEAAVPEIVVHTNAAAHILKDVKKVHGEVYVIPHGCLPCESREKYWNLYQSNHTLVQFGFGFRYKGWEEALKIVAGLKPEFPDVFFTGILSETDGNKAFHDQYFYELSGLIDKLGIRDNVGLVRGFQSEECLDSYLRTNRVAIFPYIPNGLHTVYGCSGAARLAMSKGIPVITSSVPLFDDLQGVCERPSTIEEYCIAIKLLFNDANVSAQIKKQNQFLLDNSWLVSARRYLDLL